MKKIILFIFAFIILSFSVSASLINYWNFDNNTIDSIRGYNFTNINTPYIETFLNKGMNFNE